jgi:hypothetical protein
MPQLDKVSWFAQIFWLLLCLIFFHFFMVRFFLPSIVSSLKVRTKLLRTFVEDNNKSFFIETKIKKNYAQLLNSFVFMRLRFLAKAKKKMLIFTLRQFLLLLNVNFLKDANQAFIEGYKRVRLFSRVR